ncbi:hypothetical protein GA8_18680 [Geobacillus sp. A8]|uniref:hypothetical protein n=1 Tax=Geobacillus sp. A8 TaxID=1095383 RepID=UPI000389E06D|nr:hypothetical protein [Geobacillus sp. A8]EQB94158.1 hypothetical protein GA8_18680 [Geobacillus sp. A8]
MRYERNDYSKINGVKALMENLIDYAGLFPPASLPLEKAIVNHSGYLKIQDSWILNLFVIPSYLLDELDEYVGLFSEQIPLRLSVLAKKRTV